MRSLLTCLAWASFAAAAGAQPTPYLATVTADNVSLRSGPGTSMEETGPLAKGEIVVVLHASGDQWLAVEPPRGQVSWVRTINLQEVDAGNPKLLPRNAVVHAEPSAEVAMGRAGQASPLNVRKDSVPDGTIVQVIGTNYYDTSAGRVSWTPIVPVKGECRYVPRAAVQAVKGQADPTFTVHSPAAKPPEPADPAPPGGVAPASGRIPAPAVPLASAAPAAGRGKPADWPNNYPLWRQAEQAADRGEYQRAERLYLQLGSDMSRPGGDDELANLCFSRAHAMTEKQRGVARPARPEANGTPASRSGANLDDGDRPAAKTAGPGWTAPGTVRPTGWGREGEPKYSFKASTGPRAGKVVAYIDPASAADLSQWGEGEAELYATSRRDPAYGDVPLLTVSRVRRATARREP